MLEQLGKYKILKVLGRGASGTVYLATDTFRNIDIAVKVIDSSSLSDPQSGEIFREQFFNEASLSGKLSHPRLETAYASIFSLSIVASSFRTDHSSISGRIPLACGISADVTKMKK